MISGNYEQLHEIIYSNERGVRGYVIYLTAQISHKGLGTYRFLRDKDSSVLTNKIQAQFLNWDMKYEKGLQQSIFKGLKEINIGLAEERTKAAQNEIIELKSILVNALDFKNIVDWDRLLDNIKYDIPNPLIMLPCELKKIPLLKIPKLLTYEPEPEKNSFRPNFSFSDKLFKSKRKEKIIQADKSYEEAYNSWKRIKEETGKTNLDIQNVFKQQLINSDAKKQEIVEHFKLLESEWQRNNNEYYNTQRFKIEKLKNQYFENENEAIIEYCRIVLNNSKYPDYFPKDFTIEYNSENNLLIIEYQLPKPKDLPRLSELKYLVTKKELKEIYISESQFGKLYETCIYNTILKTLYEIFITDQANAINLIVFNGWINNVDIRIGKEINCCIASIQVAKDEFSEINLRSIDPKACFKNLKGISGAQIIDIVPIRPILEMNKSDKRFVPSYEVSNNLKEGYNLALMDWEDFEHLIRELFEKEFKSNGGEVKITQASRDGGVDAIAFDPDPIRGGKIVIQAKRYTNTVGVSAVRDLYGTVMNEGAIKGILVTTADYGSDSYEFAKNKPLTLLNGANLLYLLEKHWTKS